MKPVIPSILIKSGNKKLKPQSKKSDEDFNQPEYEISKSDKIKITDIEQRFQNCEKVDIKPKIELEGDVIRNREKTYWKLKSIHILTVKIYSFTATTT